MNENLNLVKILKDCPVGIKLYSPIFGSCTLVKVIQTYDCTYPINVNVDHGDSTRRFTSKGKYMAGGDGECMLFPSKENRDWSTFKAPKKEYDFKPFEKVLVRDDEESTWSADFYSHFIDNDEEFLRGYITAGGMWKWCIPYEGNEHLVGTCNPE